MTGRRNVCVGSPLQKSPGTIAISFPNSYFQLSPARSASDTLSSSDNNCGSGFGGIFQNSFRRMRKYVDRLSDGKYDKTTQDEKIIPPVRGLRRWEKQQNSSFLFFHSSRILHAVAETSDRFQAERMLQLFSQPLHGNRQRVVIDIVPAAIPNLLQKLSPGDGFPFVFHQAAEGADILTGLQRLSFC